MSTTPTRIFAYGSLLNEVSLRKTVPDAANLYSAKVYGFRRIFNLASHHRFCNEKQSPVCVLNLEETDAASWLNGVCFELGQKSLAALIRREQNYKMHEVVVHRYNNDDPPQTARLFRARDHEWFSYLRDSPSQRQYLSLCISGCAAFGAGFLADFKDTTGFWGVDSDEEIERIWSGNY